MPLDFHIIRLKPRFLSHLSDMIINLRWSHKLCAEIQVKLGDGAVSRGYYEQHVAYEMIRCLKKQDMFYVYEVISKRIIWLADHNEVDLEEIPGFGEKEEHELVDYNFY